MTTLLYLVKPGDQNEELRYSLRTIANLPHDRVVFVGDRPSWVRNVELIPGNRSASKWLNVFDNLLIASRHLDGDFVVMNDDFMVMRPVAELLAWHRGPLAEHIASCSSGAWRRSLQVTQRWLEANDHPNPLSYELHVPVVMNAERLHAVLSPFDPSARDLPQWRTLYGNVWGVESRQMPDCKLRKMSTPWDHSWPFLSTDDRTFSRHRAALQVRAMFPDPSPYEEV